jgi:hypothetical protein
LRKEHTTRVFENGVLRKIFGPERDEVTRERGRLRNKEPYDLHSSPDQTKKEVGEACDTYGRQERWIQDFGGDT